MADHDQPGGPDGTGHPPVHQQTGMSNIDQDKMWAMLAYASTLFGLPLFIVPLAMDNLPLARYHARQAAAIYIGFLLSFVVYMVLTFVTCGLGALFFPIIFIPWIPSIHGLMLAAQGSDQEPIGVFGLGDRMFGKIGQDR